MAPATSGYSSQAASPGAEAFHAQTVGLISRSVPVQLEAIAQDVTYAVCASCCNTFVRVRFPEGLPLIVANLPLHHMIY